MRCPHCDGSGGGHAFINRGPDIRTHSLEHHSCRTCEGSGAVSEERAALISEGKAMRDARVARMESLLEASRRLGMDAAELSAIEMGCVDVAAYEAIRQPIEDASAREGTP